MTTVTRRQSEGRRRVRGLSSRVFAALLLTACGAVAIAAGPSSPGWGGAAPGIHLRIALSNASSSNVGIYAGDGLGYFAAQGIDLEYVGLGGSASEISAALATNRIDIADAGVNPAMFNSVRTGAYKVVADKGSVPKGFGFLSLVVHRDLASRVKGPADLKGLSIAMTPPGLGTANGFALSVYLARGHLTVKDVHIQPIAFPAMMAALTNKAVPVAIMTEPFATQAVKAGLVVRVITGDEMLPDQQIGTIAYGTQFIAVHRDWANRFMVAYVQGIRAYNAAFRHGTDKPRIIQILTQKTPIKDPTLWAEMIPAGLNPTGRVNVESIQQAENFFHEIGLVPQPPALSSFIDHSFVNYAAQVLGAPAP